MANTIDTLQVEITAITRDFNRQIDGVKGKLNDLNGVSQNATKTVGQFSSKLMTVGKGLAIGAAVAGIALLTANLSGAIKRVDTLNNAPKVLQNLGYSAEGSAKAIRVLSDGIDGLPTKLDDAASALTAIAAASGYTLEKATELTIAFNNMSLASGKGPEDARRALIQFTQAIGKGTLQMEDFRTLQEIMPAQLKQLAESLLGAGASSGQLQDAVMNGTLSMDDFNNAIIKLNKTGGANFASFQVQAVGATQGIGTAWTNLNTRIQKGLAEIINAMGAAGIAEKINSISTALKNGLTAIAGWIEANPKLASTIAMVAAGATVLLTAIGAIGLILPSLIAGFKLLGAAIAIATGPIGLTVIAIAALVAGIIYLWNTSEGFRNFFIGMWNMIVAAVRPVVEIFNNVLLPVLKVLWGFVVGQFQSAWNNLRSAFNSVTNSLQPLVSLCQRFMPVIKAIGIAIAVFFIAPLASLVLAIGMAITIIGVVVSVIANFISWLAKLYAQLVRVASYVIGNVVNNFRSAWNIIRGVWSAAAGFFGGIANGIIRAFSGIPGRFGGIFRSAWNQITSIFGGLASWFGNINLFSSGARMIQGLVNGIRSKIGAVKDAASSVARTVANFLTGRSPTKEGPLSGRGWLSYSGEKLISAYADGMSKSTKKVMSVASKNASGVLSVYNNMTPNLPSSAQLSSKLNVALDARVGEIDARSNHITVKIGEDTLIDRVVKGINTQSFMGNGTVIEV